MANDPDRRPGLGGSAPAAATLLVGQGVVVLGDRAFPADKDTPGHHGRLCGLMLNAPAYGDKALFRILGPMENLAWNWTPDQPVYFGNGGELTQERPTSGALWVVGFAESPTEIYIKPLDPTAIETSHRHIQNSAASMWVIVHNLGKRPSVTVVDSLGRQVVGAVQYDSDNQLTITFTPGGFAGEAYLI